MDLYLFSSPRVSDLIDFSHFVVNLRADHFSSNLGGDRRKKFAKFPFVTRQPQLQGSGDLPSDGDAADFGSAVL